MGFFVLMLWSCGLCYNELEDTGESAANLNNIPANGTALDLINCYICTTVSVWHSGYYTSLLFYTCKNAQLVFVC